ncbi:hypothetical protein ACFL2J_00675 [Candidatus Omnitrophota bacterium]
MKSIIVVMVCLFLSTSTCLSQPKYSVSAQTINDIVQLKHYMEIYLQDALRDPGQFSTKRRDSAREILNYIVIISVKLDSLISILDSENLYHQEGQSEDLTPREVSKFIDYLKERMDMMSAEIDRYLQTSIQALMIRHAEMIKGFIKQTNRLLAQAQGELTSF